MESDSRNPLPNECVVRSVGRWNVMELATALKGSTSRLCETCDSSNFNTDVPPMNFPARCGGHFPALVWGEVWGVAETDDGGPMIRAPKSTSDGDDGFPNVSPLPNVPPTSNGTGISLST
ncbi:hypothetical protein ZHAS_00007318 [Anopheles sinensis]|uniref:Uncharacterized protein n=1 Tax=Anopheles sinensis TaxID=74873 RepID=A0A084VPP2_ANOSI|nr:hypothetical protein ZHAS_00007318 [Anopheles sinensis]